MDTQHNSLIVRGRWLFPGGERPEAVVSDGALLIEDDTIQEIGTWPELRERYPSASVLGSERHAVLPGLINAHHHSNGATQIQHGIADQLLEPWLLSLARKRSADPYLVTQLAAARLLRAGVTSVVDVHSGHGSAEAFAAGVEAPLRAYEQVGIRVAFAIGAAERSHLIWGDDDAFLASLPEDVRALARRRLPPADALSVDDYFAIFDTFWNRYAEHPRIELWFAPPGPQWVRDETLQRMAELAERCDTGIQTHLEESVYEKLYGPRTYGKPTVMHLRDLGVLSPRLSFAHGVWLTEAEIELLAETGAAVSHNPSSNLRLRAGIAPLSALLHAGATVGLGMDGTTINDNEDMWQEMRLALRLHRTPRLNSPAPSPADVLRLATYGGATLLRATDRIGTLAPGYQADMVLLDLDRVSWPWIAPEVNPLELLVYRASARDVDFVLVGGQVVVENGYVTTIDEVALGRELATSLNATEFPAKAVEMAEKLTPYLEQFYTNWELGDLDPYIVYNSRS